MTEVIDATAVEDDTDTVTSTALAPTVATSVIMPFDAAAVTQAMAAYQETMRATLDASDWQGEPGARGAFVKKSGWRKIAKAFGLSVTRVEDGVERDDAGEPVRAWAVYRATAPNGQSQDGDGYCSVDESRFARSGGRQKLENDLRATATTRAKNRAISDLVGMGEVSAEEISAVPFATAFDGDLTPVWVALAASVGTDTAAKLSDWISKDNNGVMPAPVGRALVAIGRALTAANEKPVAAPAATDTTNDDLPF